MTYELRLPSKKNMLHRDFFARHAEKVALDLLGRFFVVEDKDDPSRLVYARIYEVAAYEGSSEKSMSKGSMYAPGTLSVSTKHGQRLIDVSTLEICRPSCVTLIAGLVGDGKSRPELAQGPGNLAKKLKINPDYDGMPVDISHVWFAGESAEAEEIFKRKITKDLHNFRGQFYLK